MGLNLQTRSTDFQLSPNCLNNRTPSNWLVPTSRKSYKMVVQNVTHYCSYFAKLYLPLRPCALALKRIAFGFACSAEHSLITATTILQFCSGGITGTIRCNCAISVVLAGLPASQKCQFSGFSHISRHTFQRENRHKNCSLCRNPYP